MPVACPNRNAGCSKGDDMRLCALCALLPLVAMIAYENRAPEWNVCSRVHLTPGGRTSQCATLQSILGDTDPGLAGGPRTSSSQSSETWNLNLDSAFKTT